MDNMTKEEILNMRFPFKMWLLINTENEVIEWGRNGTTVLIDYNQLDDYLSKPISIFKTKNRSSFIRQMNLYGFQKLQQTQIRHEFYILNTLIHEYRNEYFQKNRYDSLNKITRKCNSNANFLNLRNNIHKNNLLNLNDNKYLKRQQRKNDPCLNLIPKFISKLVYKRINLKLILNIQYLNRLIAKNNIVNHNYHLLSNNINSIVLTNNYINKADCTSDSIAGYYGNYHANETLKNFFGEFMPIYNQVTIGGVETLTLNVNVPRHMNRKQDQSANTSYTIEQHQQPNIITDSNNNMDCIQEIQEIKDYSKTNGTTSYKNNFVIGATIAAGINNNDIDLLESNSLSCNDNDDNDDDEDNINEYLTFNKNNLTTNDIITYNNNFNLIKNELSQLSNNLNSNMEENNNLNLHESVIDDVFLENRQLEFHENHLNQEEMPQCNNYHNINVIGIDEDVGLHQVVNQSLEFQQNDNIDENNFYRQIRESIDILYN